MLYLSSNFILYNITHGHNSAFLLYKMIYGGIFFVILVLSIVCSMSVVALAAEPNSYVKLSLTDAEIQERIERALQIKGGIER